jgi:hypothetical protein
MSSDAPKSATPFGLRVVRPYRDEDELIVAESSAFTRSGVVLLGAPSRPIGVVLRFELMLSEGASLMRGEGRVVDWRPARGDEESALALRFTRLDLKSKEMLDRAVARREAIGRGAHSIAPPAWSQVDPSMRRSSLPPAVVDRMSQLPSRPSGSYLAAPTIPRMSIPPLGDYHAASQTTPSPPPPLSSYVPQIPPLPGDHASDHASDLASDHASDEPHLDVEDADLFAAEDRTQQIDSQAILAKFRAEAAAGDRFARLRTRSPTTTGLPTEARAAALERLRGRAAQAR